MKFRPATIAHAGLLCALILSQSAHAQTADLTADNQPESWNAHFQSTGVYQGYPSITSPYAGPNSLPQNGEARETVSATGYLGTTLPWDGGEAYFDPEMIEGLGIGKTIGFAGFPNGEAQKAGRVIPELYVARLFVRQTFGLGSEQETIAPDQNQLGKTADVARITATIGKLAVNDIFDANAYSHDARTQFMNVAFIDGAAYDFAADQKGYSYGAVLELNQKDWALRASYFLVPKVADSDELDLRFLKYGAANVELETRYALAGEAGKLRILGFANQANAGSFSDTLAHPADGTNIALTRTDRTKYGFVLNLEQALSDDVGLFSRTSWNDGQEENVSYTDTDASFSLGTALKGNRWGRPDDVFGLAGDINMLSDAERKFIAAGGTGLLIGDGRLNYAPEGILEAYYRYQLIESLSLTFDYQFIGDPAYNQDRGPVHVFAGRFHVEL